jgi:hypothetical protein
MNTPATAPPLILTWLYQLLLLIHIIRYYLAARILFLYAFSRLDHAITTDHWKKVTDNIDRSISNQSLLIFFLIEHYSLPAAILVSVLVEYKETSSIEEVGVEEVEESLKH